MKEYKNPETFTEADRAIYADIVASTKAAIESVLEENPTIFSNIEATDEYPMTDDARSIQVAWLDADSIQKYVQSSLVISDGKLCVEVAIAAQRLTQIDRSYHWSISDTVPPQRQSITPAIVQAILKASELTAEDLTPYQ